MVFQRFETHVCANLDFFVFLLRACDTKLKLPIGCNLLLDLQLNKGVEGGGCQRRGRASSSDELFD